MRYFNTHGPVNETEHYVVSRDKLLAELVAQIENGKYFTIFAPRQMGKTTVVRRLDATLQKTATYLPVTLSVEDYESLPAAEFLPVFWQEYGRSLLDALRAQNYPELKAIQTIIATEQPVHFPDLRTGFVRLHQVLNQYHIALIIDEFDAVPQEAIGPLLQVWRKIYLDTTPPRSLHSVVLIGLQNIATLNLGRSSPFNIANQLELPLESSGERS